MLCWGATYLAALQLSPMGVSNIRAWAARMWANMDPVTRESPGLASAYAAIANKSGKRAQYMLPVVSSSGPSQPVVAFCRAKIVLMYFSTCHSSHCERTQQSDMITYSADHKCVI